MRKNMENESSSTVTTAVCTVGASFAAYADDVPSGPASDMELIQRREQASGSQNEAGMHRRLLAARIMLAQRKDSRQQRTRRQGNNGQTASETQGTEQGGQPGSDGMVASGGRYIDPNAPMVALT